MRKLLAAVTCLFLLAACQSEKVDEASQDNASKPKTTDNIEYGKTLVVYFSMPESDNPAHMSEDEDNSVVIIDGEVLGNTQYVANVIQEHLNADIFRIVPKTPYPLDHEALVEQADQEKEENMRPEIKDTFDNIDEYDTIFLGYPTWWSDMPMILYTFLDDYDLAGKTIIPFNTHGGSGFSDTINTIEELQPKATIYRPGFSVSRDNVEESQADIISWLDEITK